MQDPTPASTHQGIYARQVSLALCPRWRWMGVPHLPHACPARTVDGAVALKRSSRLTPAFFG